jgi:hypothetical protein
MKRSVVFLALIFMLASCTGSVSVPALSVGEEGTIDSGGEITPVGISESAIEAWTKARVAKDQHGMFLLMNSGEIFSVKTGTKVLVIDTAMAKRKIRILAGEKTGASGWVSEDYVKKITH